MSKKNQRGIPLFGGVGLGGGGRNVTQKSIAVTGGIPRQESRKALVNEWTGGNEALCICSN